MLDRYDRDCHRHGRVLITIGEEQVTAKIGEGGMGEVCRACYDGVFSCNVWRCSMNGWPSYCSLPSMGSVVMASK